VVQQFVPTPIAVLADRRVSCVTVAAKHVLMLVEGKVYSHGISRFGTLGHGPYGIHGSPESSSSSHVSEHSGPVTNVSCEEVPKEITFWTDRDGNEVATPHVVAIAAGDTSSFAFTREATFAWGKTHEATPGVDMGHWTDSDDRLPDTTLGLGVLNEHLFYPRQTDLPRL
jgi:hypothetical protein